MAERRRKNVPNDKEEKLRASVTGLFCGYGYERYRPARFESYEVYRRNNVHRFDR